MPGRLIDLTYRERIVFYFDDRFAVPYQVYSLNAGFTPAAWQARNRFLPSRILPSKIMIGA
jgi:hypothetical protein